MSLKLGGGIFRAVLVGGLALGITVRAEADFLDPANFTSLGNLSLSNGQQILFDTTTLAYSNSDGTLLGTGVVDQKSGVAVFDFSQIRIAPQAQIVGVGDRPLALLSRGSFVSAGDINVSAVGSVGGPGGGKGGGAPHASGDGPAFLLSGFGGELPGGGGGGGGFGGQGGFGGNGTPGSGGSGGSGGFVYGNLATSLQAGSGGGAAAAGFSGPVFLGRGGGGGGAIEIGALTGVSIFGGSIVADGDSFASGSGGGGGSGGGIIVHTPGSLFIAGPAALSATGGAGNDFTVEQPSKLSIGPGGGGGGGRILLSGAPGQVFVDARPDVRGGVGGAFVSGIRTEGGRSGQVVIIGVIPEPSSVVLLSVGILGLIAGAKLRSRPGVH